VSIDKRFLLWIRPYVGWLIGLVVISALIAPLEVAPVWLVKTVVDDGLIAKQPGIFEKIALIIVLIFAVKGALSYFSAYHLGRLSNDLIYRMRQRLFEHYQSLSIDFFSQRNTGELMSRISSDSTAVAAAIPIISQAVLEPFTLIGALFMALIADWRLTSIIILAMPLIGLVIQNLGRRLKRYGHRAQAAVADLSRAMHETLTNIRVVKAFNAEAKVAEEFRIVNQRLFSTSLKGIRTSGIGSPLIELIGALAMVSILVIGGRHIRSGETTPGEFIALMGLIIAAYRPLKRIFRLVAAVQVSLAAAERIFVALDDKPTVVDPLRPAPLELPLQEIRFDRVSFSYRDDRPVLIDIDLTVQAGEMIALVGTSGAGKTSLVNLLPRFYDPTAGRVLLNNCDLREISQQSLRGSLGIVTQETFLFDDTVQNNIAFAELSGAIDDERVRLAAKAAFADRFIEALPNGYETTIGERGVRLSGGQKQRIAIARAIYKNAPLLILDEATSNLDTESEREVQRAIDKLVEGRTTFVIAHRLSTIRHATRIVVLESGRIEEIGSHQQLLDRHQAYWRLYQHLG